MLDQRLWKTHVRLREEQFMREVAGDRLANGHWRRRFAGSLLYVALRDAVAVFRARITAATLIDAQPAATKPPAVSEEIPPILVEAEEIVRLYAGKSRTACDDCCRPC